MVKVSLIARKDILLYHQKGLRISLMMVSIDNKKGIPS